MTEPLTQERLKELLHYDPETGVFTWRSITSNRVKIGSEAGCLTPPRRGEDTGYRLIRIDGRLYQAHSLAYFYVWGFLPEQIDHRDKNGHNNAICNLRLCSDSQNRANAKRPVTNTSGIKGVTLVGRKWRARVKSGRKFINLGYFDDRQAAQNAYARGAREAFGEFARIE